MPRMPIQPIIKLTKKQWKVMLERVMKKEGGIAGHGGPESKPMSIPQNISKIMQHEPPVERKHGILYRDVTLGDETFRRSESLPLDEARGKYFSDPDKYTTPSMSAPDAKRLRRVDPGDPDELGAGLAYERIRHEPIVPYTTRKMHRDMKKVVQTEAKESGFKEYELPSASELIASAAVADELWRAVTGRAGNRSIVAKVWEDLRRGSRQKSKIQSGRDYFISSYLRWRQDPEKLKRAYPREYNLLERMMKAFEEGAE